MSRASSLARQTPAGVVVVVPPPLVGRVYVELVNAAARARRDGRVLDPLELELLDAHRDAAAANAASSASGSEIGLLVEVPSESDVTVDVVAVELGVSSRAARSLAARGALPGARKLGRAWLVPRVSLELEKTKRGAVA